jgi:phosphoglucosamine mutase
LPQVLVNVTVADRDSICEHPAVRAALADAERELGNSGRILLRPSGTESLVRVMVEAPTQHQADAVAHRIAAAVAAV